MEATTRARRAAEARERGRTLRRDQTPAERVLWEADLKLIVELDGGIHAEPHQAAHDQNRDAYLRSLGCTILRFPNGWISTNLSAVLQEIAQTAATLRS